VMAFCRFGGSPTLSRAFRREVTEERSCEPSLTWKGLGWKWCRNAAAKWPAAVRTDNPARAFLFVPRKRPDVDQ
jgi:hypothetical protein